MAHARRNLSNSLCGYTHPCLQKPKLKASGTQPGGLKLEVDKVPGTKVWTQALWLPEHFHTHPIWSQQQWSEVNDHSILFKAESQVNWASCPFFCRVLWRLPYAFQKLASWPRVTPSLRASAASRRCVLCRNTTVGLWVCDSHMPCCLCLFLVLLRHGWRGKVALW